jgi:hypothetical protein
VEGARFHWALKEMERSRAGYPDWCGTDKQPPLLSSVPAKHDLRLIRSIPGHWRQLLQARSTPTRELSSCRRRSRPQGCQHPLPAWLWPLILYHGHFCGWPYRACCQVSQIVCDHLLLCFFSFCYVECVSSSGVV